MKKLYWILGIIVFMVVGIYIFNYVTLIQPAANIVDKDSRNKGILYDVHYKLYVIPNTLEFNLKDVSSGKAAADVFRVFLQTASAFKNKNFKTVELQYKGTTKFVLKGDYYSQLGNEYESQNPIYLTRTFPENLYTPSEVKAYSQWEGGLLGVTTKQMEDFMDFNKKWYIEDIVNK